MMIWLFFCQGHEHFANYPGDKNMIKVTLLKAGGINKLINV